MRKIESPEGTVAVEAYHNEIGNYYFYSNGNVPLLFTENETNVNRLYQQKNSTPYVKDSINDYLIKGDKGTVNPEMRGTKVSSYFTYTIKSKGSVLRADRITKDKPSVLSNIFGEEFGNVFKTRKNEADEFYNSIMPKNASDDEAKVFRQALSGMLWSKQYYYFDLQFG